MFIVVVSPVTVTCALISHSLAVVFSPLNSACGMDNHGLICLPRLLSGSTVIRRANCVSVFGGIWSNLNDRGNQCLFHFQSGKVALTIDLWLSEGCR